MNEKKKVTFLDLVKAIIKLVIAIFKLVVDIICASIIYIFIQDGKFTKYTPYTFTCKVLVIFLLGAVFAKFGFLDWIGG